MTTRRRFLAGTGALAAGALAGGTGLLEGIAEATPSTTAPINPLPSPGQSGLDHIVVVMMENRSFDHYLGWLPGARRRQIGLTYLDAENVPHDTHHLTDPQGCDHPDPDHSYHGGRVQRNGGACDGWLRSGDNDEYAIGYYTAADQDFYRHAARYWTVCDGYFAATMGPTYPNRFYQHAAQTDRIHNSFEPGPLPTIWDRLADAGVPARYYYGDAPFIALWGTRYLPLAHRMPQFFADCAAGTLPAVSYVDPRFLDSGDGTSGDDHPHADIRVGQHFLNRVYDAVRTSPRWRHTLLVINYDEWGGFFDHVNPTTAPDLHPNTALRGFRVPCLLIGPRAPRRAIARAVYDHTSVLKLIRWRWQLPFLTARDRHARNLAEVLDWSGPPNLLAPEWDVPAPFVQPCTGESTTADYEEWHDLRALADQHGFE